MHDTVIVLSILSLVGVAVAVGAQLVLHVLPTGVHPIRNAVSDYGAGQFHVGYQVLVVALGTSAACLCLAFAEDGSARTGPLIALAVFAAARLAIARFPTDLPDDPRTTTGSIHAALAIVAFVAIAVAASSIPDHLLGVARWHDRAGTLDTIGAIVMWTAVATGVSFTRPLRHRVFGLVERGLYVAMFVWLTVAAIDLVALAS